MAKQLSGHNHTNKTMARNVHIRGDCFHCHYAWVNVRRYGRGNGSALSGCGGRGPRTRTRQSHCPSHTYAHSNQLCYIDRCPLLTYTVMRTLRAKVHIGPILKNDVEREAMPRCPNPRCQLDYPPGTIQCTNPFCQCLLPEAVVAGRYRIETLIGMGGMGAVYRASDTFEIKQVALKVLSLANSAMDLDTAVE